MQLTKDTFIFKARFYHLKCQYSEVDFFGIGLKMCFIKTVYHSDTEMTNENTSVCSGCL